MSDQHDSGRLWRIGELAEITGTTVRALHHYEQSGLLDSPHRSEGGHRLYDAAGVERLYRILALRELGLSLAEIGSALAGSALADLLLRHLAAVEAELARLALLRDRLSALTSRPAAPVGVEELVATLRAMSRVERHFAARRERVGPEATAGGEAFWRALGERVRAAMDAGASPASAEARELALAARARIRTITGGDPQLQADLARLRAESPPRNLAGWTPELMRFLDLAMAELPEMEEERC